MRVLVTGGVRSGKSRHAESLLDPDAPVTYVAAGPTPDAELDPDWVDRVARHRARRPAAWATVETLDLAGAVTDAEGPVLVDCLGTWLAGLIDEASAWESPSPAVHELVDAAVHGVVSSLEAAQHPVVVVTNEVGLGVVPEHRSGRLFRDLLGGVNQQVATACDEVHLVVAGRVLRL